MEKPKAILTFDLEFWYNRRFLRNYLSGKENLLNDYTEESVTLLLNLLKKYNHRATFFVLGKLAEKHPKIIKKIFESGHEIASHSYSHKPIYELNKADFKQELELSKNILSNIIGKKPSGFRAPNFSLNKKSKWALGILKNYDFQYDSSIHPFKPSRVPKIFPELFPSIGGNYFRKLPLCIYIFLIKYFSKNKIPVLYFHPYEFFESAPQIKSGPWWKRAIEYWGTKNAWEKFEKLIKKYKLISIEQHLHENSSHQPTI